MRIEDIKPLDRILYRLSPTRQKVIQWRFGIGCKKLSRPQISEITGLSVRYLTEIEKKAVVQLTKWLAILEEMENNK